LEVKRIIRNFETVTNKIWDFELFYDSKNRLENYLYRKGLFDNRTVKNHKIAFGGFPRIYLFINGVLVKQNAYKYINPAMEKQSYTTVKLAPKRRMLPKIVKYGYSRPLCASILASCMIIS